MKVLSAQSLKKGLPAFLFIFLPVVVYIWHDSTKGQPAVARAASSAQSVPVEHSVPTQLSAAIGEIGAQRDLVVTAITADPSLTLAEKNKDVEDLITILTKFNRDLAVAKKSGDFRAAEKEADEIKILCALVIDQGSREITLHDSH